MPIRRGTFRDGGSRPKRRKPQRSPVAIDPVTRLVRRGTITRRGEWLILRLPLLLPSPNQWLAAGGWTQYREKKRWRAALEILLAEHVGAFTARGYDPACRLIGLEPCTERRTVYVRRLVAYPHHLCKDDDNLIFTAKFLFDRLVKAGLLKDDDRAWLRRDVTQAVSPDGQPWTEIEIGPWPDEITATAATADGGPDA
ncbi:MAG: hypothetical protein AB7P99_04795 [Vicinamibacterales bacterium]